MWDMYDMWDTLADKAFACEGVSSPVCEREMDLTFCAALSEYQAPYLTSLMLNRKLIGTKEKPLLIGDNMPSLQFLSLAASQAAHISIDSVPHHTVLCIVTTNLSL